jgi:hypothetical protein
MDWPELEFVPLAARVEKENQVGAYRPHRVRFHYLRSQRPGAVSSWNV